MAGLLLPLAAPPAGAIGLEQQAQLKATYLLNFAKLVQWPENAALQEESKFLIGVHGDPYLWKACRRGLAGKKVGDMRVKVQSLSTEDLGSPPDAMRILFVSGCDPQELQLLLDSLADRPILLVGDQPEFCDLGGTIGLLEKDDRMLFEVNRTHELRNGYRINARLLRIAERVIDGATASALRDSTSLREAKAAND